jgi:hypothetical protein
MRAPLAPHARSRRMWALLVLVATTGIAAAGRPCPPGDDCRVEATKLIHPVFAWHLGWRGGPSIGAHYDFRDGQHDPATRRLVVGWQARGARLAGGVVEVLFGLHVRWRPETYELVPSVEFAAGAATPLGIPGLAIGVPILLHDDARPGIALRMHMHLFVFDYQVGVELYPGTDDVARGVLGLHLTL